MTNEQWTFWFNAANATGGTATTITLVILILKEWKTRKDVTNLAVIAAELQKQYRLMQERLKLEHRPEFIARVAGDGSDYKIEVVLTNKGKAAKIYNIVFIPVNLYRLFRSNVDRLFRSMLYTF